MTEKTNPHLEQWAEEFQQSLVQLSSVHPSAHASHLAELTEQWVEWYCRDSVELGNFGGISIADMGFTIRCHLLCLEMKRRAQVPPTLIHNLLMQLMEVSCRHDDECHTRTDEELAQLESVVARLVVQTMYSNGPQHVSELAQSTQQAIEPKLQARITALAFAERKAEKTNTSDKPLPEPEIGPLFLLLDEGRALLRLAGRVFAVHQCEQRLLRTYPLSTIWVANFTDRERQNIHLWLKERLCYESSDLKVRRIKELFGESKLPIGARVSQFRRLKTRTDRFTAQQLLEQELGVEVASAVQRQLPKDFVKVADDPTHKNYDLILFCEFEYTLEQCVRFHLDRYYVSNSQLLLTPAADDIFHKPRFGLRPRLPVITQLKGRWMIHNTGSWIALRDITEVLLMWVYLIVNEFNGCLEDLNSKLPVWCVEWLDEKHRPSRTPASDGPYERTADFLRRVGDGEEEEEKEEKEDR